MTPEERAAAHARCDAATAGPWRPFPKYDTDDSGRKVIGTVWGVGAGERTGPHRNKGLFPPESAVYYVDELAVVAVAYDRDYNSPEGAIENAADAEFIAHARTDLPAALDEIDRLNARINAMERARHLFPGSGAP